MNWEGRACCIAKNLRNTNPCQDVTWLWHLPRGSEEGVSTWRGEPGFKKERGTGRVFSKVKTTIIREWLSTLSMIRSGGSTIQVFYKEWNFHQHWIPFWYWCCFYHDWCHFLLGLLLIVNLRYNHLNFVFHIIVFASATLILMVYKGTTVKCFSSW